MGSRREDAKPAAGECPDIHELFCHYNALYFDDSLGACSVSWASSSSSSSSTPSYAGYCHYYSGGGCEIHLSELLLKTRRASDLKNVLLHEMIHAFLWIKNNNKDHSDHGRSFKYKMKSINSSSVIDPQRPRGGYNITVDHNIQDHDNDTVHQWICELCGTVSLSTSNKRPSARDCTENLGPNECCDNPSCHWHSHKKLCSGRYSKYGSPECNGDKTSSRAEQERHEAHTAEPVKQRLRITGHMKETINGKKNSMIKPLPSSGDASQSLVIHSSSRDKSWKEDDFDQPENIESQLQRTVGSKVQKRRRTSTSRKTVCTRSKRRKLDKCDKGHMVVIEWLGIFEDEETDEDLEPLVNKRSERRKKQKLLNDPKDWNAGTEVPDDATPAHTGCSRNGDTEGCKSACGSLSEPMTEEQETSLILSNYHQTVKPEIHAKYFHIVKSPSTGDGLCSQPADDQNVNWKRTSNECRDVKMQEGISPNFPIIVDIPDD